MYSKIRKIEFTAKKEVLDYFSGAYHSAFKGRGIDIDDLREFVSGDDVRNIAWKKTAQMGRPFVKNFKEERDLTVLLLVDTSSSLHFQGAGEKKREYVASLCSLIIFSAMANRDKIGALFFSSEVEKYVPPKRGEAHGVRLISEILEQRQEKPGTDIQGALQEVAKVLKKKAIIFVLSDFYSDDFSKGLFLQASKNDVILVRVVDPLEKELPLGCICLKDFETGVERVIEVTPKFQEKMRKKHGELSKRLKDMTALSHSSLIDLETSEECYVALRHFFQERKLSRYQ